MSKVLKYKELIDRMGLSNCPFPNCNELTLQAYRWTYDQIGDQRNFVPKAADGNAPPRRNSETDEFKCSCCALSMYTSEDAAKRKFNGFPDRIKRLLGYSHIAQGSVTPEVGLSGQVNSEGHFDLFEYAGVDLTKVFNVIGPI